MRTVAATTEMRYRLKHDSRLPAGAGGFRVLGICLCIVLAASSSRSEINIFSAAEAGHTEVVGQWADAAEDFDPRDPRGRTPLWYACSRGRADVVDLLVARGADVDVVDRFGVSPLTVAIKRAHSDVVAALLEAGAVVNPPEDAPFVPLHIAVEQGDADIVLHLLNAGADPLTNQVTGDPANDLVRNAMIRTRLRGMAQDRVLILGAASVTRLTFDVETGHRGGTLTVADERGLEVFSTSLPASDAPELSIRWDHRGSGGREIPEGVYTLRVDLGDGQPLVSVRRALAFHRLSLPGAASYVSGNVIRAFGRRGNDLNVQDAEGRTPLMIAAAFGNTEAVAALVALGANPEVVDTSGRSAFDYAEAYAPGQKVGGLLKRAVDDARFGR